MNDQSSAPPPQSATNQVSRLAAAPDALDAKECQALINGFKEANKATLQNGLMFARIASSAVKRYAYNQGIDLYQSSNKFYIDTSKEFPFVFSAWKKKIKSLVKQIIRSVYIAAHLFQVRDIIQIQIPSDMIDSVVKSEYNFVRALLVDLPSLPDNIAFIDSGKKVKAFLRYEQGLTMLMLFDDIDCDGALFSLMDLNSALDKKN